MLCGGRTQHRFPNVANARTLGVIRKQFTMSRSIQTTKKDFKGLTKAEIDDQSLDPNSDLTLWNKKSQIKRKVKKNRKAKK